MLKIYQIKDLNTPYCFCGWGKQTEHDFNPEDYECVFETEKNDTDDLENIFSIFNGVGASWTRGFKGRSMSVSDIVELNGEFFYCDTIGWQKIEVFSPNLSDREISNIIRDFVHKYLAPLVSADYIESIEDILVDDALHDIRETADRNFNDDDIRLAVGRSLVSRLGIEG